MCQRVMSGGRKWATLTAWWVKVFCQGADIWADLWGTGWARLAESKGKKDYSRQNNSKNKDHDMENGFVTIMEQKEGQCGQNWMSEWWEVWLQVRKASRSYALPSCASQCLGFIPRAMEAMGGFQLKRWCVLIYNGKSTLASVRRVDESMSRSWKSNKEVFALV